jgi:hypothetical protein
MTRGGLLARLGQGRNLTSMTHGITRAGSIHCLACGNEMAPALREAGSLRCHDCRAVRAPLRPDLVKLISGNRRPALRLVTGDSTGWGHVEGNRPLAA